MFLFSAYLPVQNKNLGLMLEAEAIHLTHTVLKSFLEKYCHLYIITLFPNKCNLINICVGSPSRNSQHHGQTIHSTEKRISMNLFKFLWRLLKAKNTIVSTNFGIQCSVHTVSSILGHDRRS